MPKIDLLTYILSKNAGGGGNQPSVLSMCNNAGEQSVLLDMTKPVKMLSVYFDGSTYNIEQGVIIDISDSPKTEDMRAMSIDEMQDIMRQLKSTTGRAWVAVDERNIDRDFGYNAEDTCFNMIWDTNESVYGESMLYLPTLIIDKSRVTAKILSSYDTVYTLIIN